MKPPIKSKKHYVQFGIDQILTGVSQSISLVDANDGASADEVEQGSIIKAVYIELWLQNQSNLGEQITCVTKGVAGDSGPTFAEMATLFTYNNKKNVLFTSQGLTSNDGISGPQFILRQWIKIPKSKQRFGLTDRLTLNIANVSSNSLNRCGLAIYKEYT